MDRIGYVRITQEYYRFIFFDSRNPARTLKHFNSVETEKHLEVILLAISL